MNIPVVKSNPFNINVPAVNVVVPVAVNVNAAANVVVPNRVWCAIVSAPNVVLLVGVIVPVPFIVAVKLVNVPLALNINEFKNNVVVAIVNAVVPKSNVLNQLPVDHVMIAVPLPVKVKLGALVELPEF